MKTIILSFLIFIFFGVTTTIFLYNWEIPVNTKIITKVIPDEKFRK